VKRPQKDAVAIFLKKISKTSGAKISRDEVLSLVEKIAQTHMGKTFAYMTVEDIASQARLICMQQLKFYEPEKGIGWDDINSLERWLNRVVKNRLKNFYRDHCGSLNEQHKKARVSLSAKARNSKDDSVPYEPATCKNETENSVVFGELKDFVEARLSEEGLEIYRACLSEEPVNSYYKNKLRLEITQIMGEWRDGKTN
jgi:hypothetical protein